MVIKNGYEARLAKMAGDENVTIPKPTNAYMKYMDDIDVEGGGGGGSGTGWLVVNDTYDTETDIDTLDKTAEEIWNAYPFVVAVDNDGQDNYAYWINRRERSDLGYRFEFRGDSGLTVYAASASDYPTSEEPGGGGGET